MKLKKILAVLSAVMLGLTGMTALTGNAETTKVFGDIDGNGTVDAGDAALILQYAAEYGSGSYKGTLEQYVQERVLPQIPEITDGGDVLTIASWNDNDLKNMIEVFQKDNPDIQAEYVNCGATSGAGADAAYQSFLNSGEGVDMFIAESGWILHYINDDRYSVPLSQLNITDADFADAYDYTVAIGTDNQGTLKAASWQAAPGGYCYNATLAEQYLGVKTPEEMQEKINDWDKFGATAKELSEATEGAVKIADSIDGMWQCYATSSNSPWIVNEKVNTSPALDFLNLITPYVTNEYIDTTVAQFDPSWTTLGKENLTLGYFFSTWCLTSGNQLEQNCGTDGNWRIVKGPEEYFWGGSWLCVSPHCDNKTAAEKFIRYFTSDADTMEKYALASGDFVNNQKVMEKIVADGSNSNPLLGGQDQFAVLKDVASNITLNQTITPYDESLKLSLKYALYSNISSIYDNDYDSVIEAFLQEAETRVPKELFATN